MISEFIAFWNLISDQNWFINQLSIFSKVPINQEWIEILTCGFFQVISEAIIFWNLMINQNQWIIQLSIFFKTAINQEWVKVLTCGFFLNDIWDHNLLKSDNWSKSIHQSIIDFFNSAYKSGKNRDFDFRFSASDIWDHNFMMIDQFINNIFWKPGLFVSTKFFSWSV